MSNNYFKLNIQQQPAPFNKFALNTLQYLPTANHKPNKLVNKMAIPMATTKSKDDDDSSANRNHNCAERSKPINVPMSTTSGQRSQTIRQSIAGSPPRHSWNFLRDYQSQSEMMMTESLVSHDDDNEEEEEHQAEIGSIPNDNTNQPSINTSEIQNQPCDDEPDAISTSASRPQGKLLPIRFNY